MTAMGRCRSQRSRHPIRTARAGSTARAYGSDDEPDGQLLLLSFMPSLAVVLVVAAEPGEGGILGTRLVSPSRCPVEPLVHAPESVHPARVGRVGVVDDAVLARERAHTGSLPRVRRPIRPGGGRPLG